MEYLIWFFAVCSITLGSYYLWTTPPGHWEKWTWLHRHPKTVATFLTGLAIIQIVLGLDVRGIF